MNFPDIPEYAAGYFNFIIDFAISPNKACERFKSSKKIDKDLLTYAAFGALLTWLTISILRKAGESYNDKSRIFEFTNSVEMETLPFVVLPFIILISLIIHISVKLILRISNVKDNPGYDSINLKNTINGALAFFSFGPFIVMFFFLLTMMIVYNINAPKLNQTLFILLVMPCSLLGVLCIFWYFPSALSAMQADELKKSYRQAMISIYILVIIVCVFISRLNEAIR